MKTMGERLRFRRKQLGLSQGDVAARVRQIHPGATFKQQAYQQLESGKARSSVELPAICEALAVDLRWIRDNAGTPPAAPGEEPNSDMLISSVDAVLERARPDVIFEADVRGGAGGGGVPATPKEIFDRHGNTYAAEGVAGEWSLPRQVVMGLLRASPKDLLVFEVIGDSMEPRLKESDRVFVDKRMTFPNPEGIFVLWDGYSVVVKQLQIVHGSDPLRLRVLSLNPQYEPYEVLADEVNIIGRYAGRFTTD
jgi:phage repressor protein C with HTH and peptisase S24 domain